MRTAAIFALVGTISALDDSAACKDISDECTPHFKYECAQKTTRAKMQAFQTGYNHQLLTVSAKLAAENKTVTTLT